MNCLHFATVADQFSGVLKVAAAVFQELTVRLEVDPFLLNQVKPFSSQTKKSLERAVVF